MKSIFGIFALLLIAFITACADHPGKWQALSLERSEPPILQANPVPGPPADSGTKESSTAELPEVERGHLDFVKKEVKVEQGLMRITGTLRKGEDPDREITLEGKIVGETGVVQLHEVSEKLEAQNAAAMMYCLGEGPNGEFSCDDFYMNVYVADEDQGKIYGDQFVVRPQVEIEKTKPETELPHLQVDPLPTVEIPPVEMPEAQSYFEEKNISDAPKSLLRRGFPVDEKDEIEKLNLQLPAKGKPFTSSTSTTTLPKAPVPPISTTTTTTSTTTTTTTTTLPKAQAAPVSPPPPPVVQPAPPSSSSTSSTTTTTTTMTSPAPVQTPSPLQPVSDGIQAIGSHAHGRLRNPTDLLALSSLEGSYFQFVKPKEQKYYGTTLMAQFLKLLGESLQEILPGQKLLVGSVSDANGGSLPPHSSHQTGLDADISYLVNDPRFNFSVVTTSTGVVDAFLAKENWQLFKKAFATNLVAGIFVDRKIRNALCAEAIASGDLTGPEDRGEAYQVLNRISVEAGHHHHFHVRLKCPENENEKDVQKRCEVADPGTETVNCFSAVPKTVQQSMKK